jgi:ketosteroid isomerase-like protein
VTPENLETLKRFHDLLNDRPEAPLEVFHPEAEIHMFEGSPIRGPYYGHEGVRRWREDSFDVIEDPRLELDEVIRFADPDLMVVAQRFVGHLRHADLAVDFPLWVVFRFRDGLIARCEGHRERHEALAAAGLEE